MISDEDLADELIARLNRLIEDPAIRGDVEALIDAAVPASETTVSHPTIQCGTMSGSDASPALRLIGLLNGVVGVRPDGTGYGYISRDYDDSGALAHFGKWMRGQRQVLVGKPKL